MASDEKKEATPQQGQGAVQDKMLVIPLSLAQGVLNYLAKQPCGEVYNFVTALINLKEVPQAAPPVLTPVPNKNKTAQEVAEPEKVE